MRRIDEHGADVRAAGDRRADAVSGAGLRPRACAGDRPVELGNADPLPGIGEATVPVGELLVARRQQQLRARPFAVGLVAAQDEINERVAVVDGGVAQPHR